MVHLITPLAMSLNTKKAETKLAWSSAFTLANTMVGCALLSLAYAFSQIGWIISMIIFLLCAVFEYFAYCALADCAHYGQQRTPRGIMKMALGNVGGIISDISVALNNIGFLIAYVTIFADYIQAFIVQVGGGAFNVIWIKLIAYPILLALSFLKSADGIAKASAVAILLIVIAVVAICVYFFIFLAKGTYWINTENGNAEIDFPGPKVSLWPEQKGTKGALDVFKNIPLFMPLFGAQASVAVLYYDIEGPPNFKRRVMHRASLYALLMAGVMYTFVGLFGVWMFGHQVRDNILMSFLETEIVMTIARLIYGFVVILSFIVIIYPARATFMEWFHLDVKTKKGLVGFQIIGCAIVTFSVGISIAVPSISTVINIISSVFGTVTYWCMPMLAIWLVPKFHANTTVPETDDEKDLDDAIAQVRGRSLSLMIAEQQISRVNAFQERIQSTPRPRTRSQIIMEEREKRTRTGSLNIVSTVQQQPQAPDRVVREHPAGEEHARKSSFEKVSSQKPRATSIGAMRPTLENELLSDEVKNQPIRIDLIAAQVVKEDSSEKVEEPTLQIGAESAQPEACDEEAPQFALGPEERAKYMSQMTKKRSVCNVVTNSVFIAINLLAFVLTFVKYK